MIKVIMAYFCVQISAREQNCVHKEKEFIPFLSVIHSSSVELEVSILNSVVLQIPSSTLSYQFVIIREMCLTVREESEDSMPLHKDPGMSYCTKTLSRSALKEGVKKDKPSLIHTTVTSTRFVQTVRSSYSHAHREKILMETLG